MAAQQGAGFAVADHFDKTFRMIGGHRFAETHQRELADRDRYILLRRFLFGHADSADFRERIDRAWNGGISHLMMTKCILNRDGSLSARRVSEHDPAIRVADA